MKKLIVMIAMAVISSTALAWDWSNPAPSTASANDYGRGGSMIQGNATEGVIVNVRMVRIEASSTANAAGMATGAALGGLIGQRAGNGNGKIAATILGGLIGGVTGNAVTNRVADVEAQELVVRLRSGQLVVITQGGDERFEKGMDVYIINMNGNARVTRA